jgi:signal transduction histidine kinase
VSKKKQTRIGDSTKIRNYPRMLRRYERLIEITTDLVSSIDQHALLNRIVLTAQELTDCEAASLLLHDPQTDQLYFEAATTSLDSGMGQKAVPTDRSIAGWVYSSGEIALVDDVLQDSRFFSEVDAVTNFTTRSILCVPLRLKEKILGVIEAVNKKKGSFDEDDVTVLRAVATQAAISIENSRLFKQSDLISELVHELRSPLTALIAAAHILQRRDLGAAERDRLLATIMNESLRLDTMARGFLDLSRMESGRAQFNREPVHLGGLVEECLEIIRPQATSEKIKLQSELDTALSPVMGDRNRLKQLLLNLLTNAIKYNKSGGWVRVILESDEDEVLLSVKDSGCGIPAKSLPRVFERFYRGPDQEDQSLGAGLGLAIAKRIVENHRGEISVVSKVGKGSTFTVRIPI